MIRLLVILVFFYIELFAIQYKSIEFKGNDTFFSQTLLDVLGIKKKPVFSGFKKDENISVDDITDLKDRIVDFYNSKGFYKCEVAYEEQDNILIFVIKEDEPVRIVSFTTEVPSSLKSYLTMKVGDIFDADKYVEMKTLVRRNLDESGYPKAKIVSSAIISIDPYRADLDLNITNYKQTKIAKLILPNIPRISKDAIRNKLTFKEGDTFDIRELEKSRENLYMTDIFSTVKLDIENEDSEDENVTVAVNLDKAKEKSIKTSIGYSTDEGPRVKFSWIDKNMFDDFRRLETSLNIMQYTQSAEASVLVPTLYGLPFEDKVALQQDEFPYLGYQDKTLSNTFRFSFDILSTKHFLGLKTEQGFVKADMPSQYIKNQSYTTNAILYEYLLDKRDSKLDATNGFLIDMNIEFANNIFASSLNYVKSELEGREIYTFPRTSLLSNLTIALKGKIGDIEGMSGGYIPIFKRFFAGGSFSNRGYAFERMGPMDSNGNYIGAKSIIDTSTEARYRLTQKFSMVLFYDSTMLSYKSLDFASSFKPAVGMGGRYETGVGPIRFDIGVPLNEDKRSPVFHISFGQAF